MRTRDGILLGILLVLLLSLIPIWRIAGSKEGENLWDIMHWCASNLGNHLAREDAIQRATEAYRVSVGSFSTN